MPSPTDLEGLDNSPHLPSFPFAALTPHDDKTVATCPECGAQYDVTEVFGNMAYDRHPEVPGQQARCQKCDTVFTLPDTE